MKCRECKFYIPISEDTKSYGDCKLRTIETMLLLGRLPLVYVFYNHLCIIHLKSDDI